MALRHYTDNVGREGIEGAGWIYPGLDELVYLTPDEYDDPNEATKRLALPRVPSGYFEIPSDRLRDLSSPAAVASSNDQPGGGLEQHTTSPIAARDLRWVGIKP